MGSLRYSLPRLLRGSLLILVTACASQDDPQPQESADSQDNTEVQANIQLGTETGGKAGIAFSPLFDPESGLSRWQAIGTEDAVFSFDKDILEVRGDRGWLRSPRLYADFILRLQFRFLEPDSDSGIFLRVAEDGPDFIRGWPGAAYQIQVRDLSMNQSDSPLPLANVYRHHIAEGETTFQRSSVFELYSGLGEWQDMEITVIGTLLSVRLNGVLVTTARDIINPTGRIGFQSEAGVVQFRKLTINEL